MGLFIEPADLIALTGRKIKSLQIEQLCRMGIPFQINAVGKPVVTVAAIEGRKETPKAKQWEAPRHGPSSKP